MYVSFLNGEIVQPMGYWLKSFNTKPAPVHGVSYTVPQINLCECFYDEFAPLLGLMGGPSTSTRHCNVRRRTIEHFLVIGYVVLHKATHSNLPWGIVKRESNSISAIDT